jgi:hypothetical protein
MSIKVHLSKNKGVIEGDLFAVDPLTNTVVLECDQEYKIVLPKHISKLDGTITADCAPDVPPSLIR